MKALDVVKSYKALDSLLYNGERNPHTWWGEFKRLLYKAFTIYDRRKRRVVHSKHTNLRILCRKIIANFLQHSKASINIELATVPINITNQEALTSLQNQVNLKHLPQKKGELGYASSECGYGRQGRAKRGGFGSGRGCIRGGRSVNKRGRNDFRMRQCVNSTQIEVHMAYQFTDTEWNNLPYDERTRILE